MTVTVTHVDDDLAAAAGWLGSTTLRTCDTLGCADMMLGLRNQVTVSRRLVRWTTVRA